MNPYESPQNNSSLDRKRTVWKPIQLMLSAYGLFACLWFLMSVGLYFFVFGDNSSNFGLFSVPPAIVGAIGLTWRLSAFPRALAATSIAMIPVAICFTIQLLMYG